MARLNNRFLLAIGAAAILSISGAAIGSTQDAPEDTAAVAPSQSINIVATDFAFDPRVLNAKPGATTFWVKNGGILEHNFAIEKSPSSSLGVLNTVSAGGTGELDVVL